MGLYAHIYTSECAVGSLTTAVTAAREHFGIKLALLVGRGGHKKQKTRSKTLSAGNFSSSMLISALLNVPLGALCQQQQQQESTFALHRDPFSCATVKVPPFYLSTFQVEIIPRLDVIIFCLVSQFLEQVLSRSFASPPPLFDFPSFFPTPSRGIFPSFSGFTTQASHLKRCT